MSAYFVMRVSKMNKLQIIFIQLYKHVNIYLGQVMEKGITKSNIAKIRRKRS